MADGHVTTKSALAKTLSVSRSSLYYKPKKLRADEELKQRILAVMDDHPAYGHRRIAMALRLNKKRIGRIMRRFGLHPQVARKKPFKPEDIGRKPVPIPNLIKLQCPIRANAIWIGDFTHVVFFGRFLYIATVMDLHTREILGWHVAWHHTSDLIIKAFEDAARRRRASPRIFHSDQGSEYVSGSYADLLQTYEVQPSFSKKSSPWENGYQESFYGNFKLELGCPNRFDKAERLIEAIHHQMFYYNNKRIHSALKMPPSQFYVLKKSPTLVTA